MNSKIDKYKNKANRIVRTVKLIGILTLLLGVLISIVQYSLKKRESKEELLNSANISNRYSIDLEDNKVIYTNNLNINLKILEFDEVNNYKVEIKVDGKTIIQDENIRAENNFSIELEDEGRKVIEIIINKNGNEEYNQNITTYYIKPYEKQFLDKYCTVGVSAHFGLVSDYKDNIDESIELIKALGTKWIRDSIRWDKIQLDSGEFDFSYVNDWLNELNNNNINIVSILVGLSTNYVGTDGQISTDEELQRFSKYVDEVTKKYNFLKHYEIWNEPDAYWKSEEQKRWYSKTVNASEEAIHKNIKDAEVIAGALTMPYQEEAKPINWISDIMNYGSYKATNAISYHPYAIIEDFKRIANNYKTSINERQGGFLKRYATEFGRRSTNQNEAEAAEITIKEIILNQMYGVDLSIIYQLRSSESDAEFWYGLLNKDYTPKPVYYAMKNYYQNTNGSEYIGTLNVQDGLEAHVYNKDGKPLIILWSANKENTFDFGLNNMTAKDIYGKELTRDLKGKIPISTSPVYIYNSDYNTFYQAISNTATTKYDEFSEKFAEQISKVSELEASIRTLKERMNNIANNSTLDETTAKNLMEQHYTLGNKIIQSYKSKELQIEYVKLSSMLDYLNDIGISYEDLVTVSRKTRNVNLAETLNSITSAENTINNSNIEMIYPSKIVEFSKDYYEKADYINSLEEENDIKTGLIVSKNLHSKLLANWAKEFANLYIDEYIDNNPVEIVYSTTDITNQPVTATLNTNADITITNNQNSKTYTFNQNGTFKFEYTIKGRALSKTATVNNIDKIAPNITGVESEKLYKSSVTPKIQDENLKEVKLYKDLKLVNSYKVNDSLSADGQYKIVALDKAGNQTTIIFYIAKNPATIRYSTTSPTNKDVTATLVSNYNLEVTNNSKNKAYKFTQNGEFTFSFKVKGVDFNLTAVVNNIDKTPPQITGVVQDKLYLDKAKPVITDNNLNSVKLYLNSKEVKNYSSGSEISKEGFYKVVAKDKAGNETSVEFAIKESSKLEYKFNNSYILNIKNNTKLADFKQKFNVAINYNVIRKQTTLNSNDKIATGDILKTGAGDEYTLVVNGDINKDGDVNMKDVIKLRIYLLQRNNLDQVSLLAADCNQDGKSISIKDLIRMRLLVLERDVT